MYTLITILILICSILLVLVVLVQNSKGGGLASNFAASNQIMGVKKTSDFLEKATWTLAIGILCLSLMSIFAIKRNATQQNQDTQLKEVKDKEGAKPVQSMPVNPQQK